MPSVRFRQDTVRTLPFVGKHSKQQCIYWDEGLECFGLRVYPSGRRLYVCSYRVHRRKRLASLGRVDVLTLDQARKKAIAYLGKVAGNEDAQGEADKLRKASSVKEVVAAYIEHHAKSKKRSWKGDESILRRRLLPSCGSRLAASIESADIQKIHSEVGAMYPYAANRSLEVVRKMFNWSRVGGFVPKDHSNPAVGIARYPERKRKRFVTTAEMPRFTSALEEEDNEFAKHGIWLLLLTGLRSTELLKAKWTDIDWNMGTLFIGLTKNGEPLLAPLSASALSRLQLVPRLAGNPHIVCGRNLGQPLSCLGPALKRVLKKSELENIRIHDLRRTVGSWLAQHGHTLHLIGNVLNHRDPKTTAGYAYFQTQQRQDALTAYGEKILSFAPQGVRTEETAAYEAPASTAGSTLELASATTVGTARAHYIDRTVLYHLVWEAPVSEVADRFGVSDVALAKACRRAAVPVPPRGYWAKAEAGVLLDRPALPPTPPASGERIRIRGRLRRNSQYSC